MTKARSIPKYQAIRDELLRWMESGMFAHGDKLPVEAELAERFSASRQTVRQAVGELVRQGYLERRQGSGTYFMSSSPDSPTRAKTRIIGVITTYISDYIFPDIIRGIVDRLRTENYSPLLYSTQDDLALERQALEDVLSKDVDAVIVEATKGSYPNSNLDLYQRLREQGIPVVMLHARYPGLDVPLVEVNDAAGAFTATAHLVQQGHERIGAILKLDDLQGVRRMEGFTTALGEHSLPFRAHLMSFYTTEGQPEVALAYAERLQSLSLQERPTAVFCYNDSIAVSLIGELVKRGISVPEHMSVVGFDDASIARVGTPPLTTVAHPKYDMGVRVADMIMRRLHGQPLDSEVYTFTPELIVRASSQSPSAAIAPTASL